MNINEVKADLEKRKSLVAEVSAYSRLRRSIRLLCTLYIIGVIIWLSISLIVSLKGMNGEALFFTVITYLGSWNFC